MISSGDSKKDEEPPKEAPRGTDDTHIVFKAEQRDQETKIIPGGQLKPLPGGTSQEPTGAVVGIAKKPMPGRPAIPARDDTTVFMPSRGQRVTPTAQAGAVAPADATVLIPSGARPGPSGAGAQFDPVAGWLVVLEGPGKGNFKPVYYGQNSLGRGPDQRIALDFGDQGISRDTHAFIVYDDVERKFYVRDNHKPNLVRLAGKPVMSPTELLDRQEIRIGDTTLLFVALCGSAFDWFVANGQGKS